MAGTITAASISGSLDAKNLVMQVLTKSLDISNLSRLGPTVQVPELNGTIAVQATPDASEDLVEFEHSAISPGAFSYVNFDLKKDRVLLATSDEAQFKSRAGDPLSLQIGAAAQRLAYILDKKIITAMQTSPQTGAAAAVWSTATNNFMVDLAVAAAALKPYVADYIVVPPAVWAKMVGNNYMAQMVQGNAVRDGQRAIAHIPGLELDVYVNSNVTAKTCVVGASQAPGFVIGQGPVKVRKFDMEEGGEAYQIDNWRQVKAPILKNDSSLNMGVYVLTAVIA